MFGRLRTVTLILEKQADPNAIAGLRAGGETPLRMAVQIDKPTDAPTVKLLLGARADPTVCNLAGCSAKFAANLRGSGNPSVPKMVGTRNRQSGTRQSGFSEARSGDTLTHPMHLASTWRKARFRPRHTPRLIHTQERKGEVWKFWKTVKKTNQSRYKVETAYIR